MTRDFSEFSDESQLRALLVNVAGARKLRAVEVACLIDGVVSHASAVSTDQCQYAAKGGCIAKFLTGMLVAHAIADEKLDLGNSVAEQLRAVGLISTSKAQLQDMQVINLLNHTHGLDDSAIQKLPLLTDGSIDAEQLIERLLVCPSLAPVGRQFSYGNAGAWLAAALLERLYAMPYRKLLREKLIEPLGLTDFDAINNDGGDRIDICPAIGNQLRLTAQHLVAFARLHLPSVPGGKAQCAKFVDALRMLRSHSYEPTSWQPKFRRVCLGINDYGDGWFGHNSKFEGDSAMLRFSPERNVAMAITARNEDSAHEVLGAMFGKVLPEFARRPVPRSLSEDDWREVEPSPFLGEFGNASMSITVDVAANKSLRVRVYRRHTSTDENPEPIIKRYLKPAEGQLFFSMPAEPLVVPFVQFLDPDAEGRYRYLHTGRKVFPRIQQ